MCVVNVFVLYCLQEQPRNEPLLPWKNGWAMKMALFLLAWKSRDGERCRKMLHEYSQNKKMKVTIDALKVKVQKHGWPTWSDPDTEK